jgi:hypothetical protein
MSVGTSLETSAQLTFSPSTSSLLRGRICFLSRRTVSGDSTRRATATTSGHCGRSYLAIFNCDVDSGCSRLHKHMQILPDPDAEQFALWPDVVHDPQPIARSGSAPVPSSAFYTGLSTGFPGPTPF